MRDPESIARIDLAIDWAKQQVNENYGPNGDRYRLYYHIYGKNAILGELEPMRKFLSHELGIVVEVIADTLELAEEITKLASRGIFYARLQTRGTAGGAAFLSEDVLQAKAAYSWTVNHVIEVEDPLKYFPTRIETVKG